MILSLIAVIFTFGIVITLHEFGHFILCKLLKVKVEEFSFGFGKPIFSKQIGETLYAIRWIPLGGYVKPKGEDITEVKGDDDEYFSKKWYERILIVLAGPAMNYFLSFVIFFFVIYFVGKPVPSDKAIIGNLAPNYPAQIAGLKEGDKIVKINSQKITSWQEMSKYIHESPEKEIEIEYVRDNKTYKVKLKPVKSPDGRGLIGIGPVAEYKHVGVLKAINYSLYQLWYWTSFTVETLARNIYKMEKPDVAGPIGIITIVAKAAHSDFADFMFLVGLISIAVGFFNLLPLPLLDGGHAVLYFFEGLFRKKLTPNIIKYVNSTGIALLLSILIFATYNDIMRIYHAKKEKAEIKVEKVKNEK